MHNRSRQEWVALYAALSTDVLSENYRHFQEKAELFHGSAATRGNRDEAHARYHLNIINEILKERDAGTLSPPRDKSKVTLGELLTIRGQKLGVHND